MSPSFKLKCTNFEFYYHMHIQCEDWEVSHLDLKKFLAQSHGHTHRNKEIVSSDSSEFVGLGRRKLLRKNVHIETQRESN